MKKLITMVIMVLAVAVAMAQAPEKFTYQAVVRSANNALVTNTLVGVRVSILQGSATGSGVYVETQMPSTNANGLITLNIGDGNAVFGTFGSIDWSAGPYFLKTEIDPAGGNNYSVTSTQQLLSVPYALYAKEAGNGFSGDYNDLTNTPTIPTVPTNVSAFTNDAGYITMDSVPAIPTVPTNVSAFTNDAGYLTGYTETDPQFNAWDKDYNDLINKPVLFDGDYNSLSNKPVLFDGDYNSLTNQPTIPTVPTNVSAFTNDAGYITMDSVPAIPANVSAFTNDAGYLTGYTETDPTVPAWAKEANKPTYDYTEITNTPVIPTVPTNVSAFTNDAGYLTSYTETDPQFNAWDKSYNDLINTPTNVSAFANDAQYITAEAIPTQVSAFTNDAEYITVEAVPTQVSAFENDALYITEGELQQTVNVINNTFDSVDNVMNDMDNTIDSLRNRIEELEGTHTPPTVMTTGAADVAFRAAVVNGSIVHVGASPVTARGFCYDTVMHPTVDGNLVNCGSGAGDFSTNLLNIAPNTTYYVRAYATNIWGTNYGNELSFTTLVEHAPSVEILPASEISYTSFVCSGDVTDSGTYSVTARGFCWSTDPDPVMTGEHLHVGNGSGTFSAMLANMQPETTFYVRAYAVNAAGVTYSTPITVSTLSPTIPTVSTDTVNGYNECTGTVLADGNAPVTQRGFCYDTLPSPTLENGVVIADGSGLGEFTATLTGLPVGKLYFVRAFATNAKGTAYGNQIHFHASSCDTKTLTDYDGNVYNTVAIGTQCWMKENLKTTHYSDGWPIDYAYEVTNEPSYYYPCSNNASGTNNVAEFGLLYNRPAVMRNDASTSNAVPSGVQGICPIGWHVPSYAEWTQLTQYLTLQNQYLCDNNTNAIAKSLAASSGWSNSDCNCCVGNNQSANNATGFNALPAGFYWGNSVGQCGQRANFWTCSWGYLNFQYCRLSYDDNKLSADYTDEKTGLSVRCLRDY